MLRTFFKPVRNALFRALERRGIPREDVERDIKLTPNRISLVRIYLSPVPAVLLVVWMILGSDDSLWRWLTMGTFVVLAASDGIDGYLARKYNQTSELGKVLDPIGDKLLIVLTLLVMVCMFWEHRYGIWFYGFVLVAVAREVILTLQIRAAHDVVTSPTLLGKLKTVVQATAIAVWLTPLEQYDWWGVVVIVALVAAFTITLASWWEYDQLFVREYRQKRRASRRSR